MGSVSTLTPFSPPEESEYTSIRQRIQTALEDTDELKVPLLPFADEAAGKEPDSCVESIPCTFAAYLELIEATGRTLVPGKRGTIPDSAAPILKRLGLDHDRWLKAVASFGETPCPAVGNQERPREMAKALRTTKRAWYSGRSLEVIFG